MTIVSVIIISSHLHWSLGWTINPASHLSIITKHAPSQPPSELDRPELSDGAPLLSGQSQTNLMVPWQGGLDSKLICLKSTQERDLYLLMVFFVSLTTREKSQWQATSHCRHFFRLMPRTALRLTSNRVITLLLSPLQGILFAARPLANISHQLTIVSFIAS